MFRSKPPSMANGLIDRQLCDALLNLGVDPSWAPLHRLAAVLDVLEGETAESVARRTRHRQTTIGAWLSDYNGIGLDAFLPLHQGPGRPRGATLAAMLSGRLTEEAWASTTATGLGPGFRLVDARDQDPDPGWDFEIASTVGGAGGFTVDVKLHNEPFREAERYVGLAADDCIPLGIYKMLVARARQRAGGSHHIYAFLFRPGLADDLVQALTTIPHDERVALEHLFHTTADGRKGQQRRGVATIVDRYLPALLPLVDGSEFRVISTHRASNLFLELVETRAPMLSGRGSGFGATINMHYSWQREMTPWNRVLRQLTQQGLQPVLDDFTQGRT